MLNSMLMGAPDVTNVCQLHSLPMANEADQFVAALPADRRVII